jgi:hypothetical protein
LLLEKKNTKNIKTSQFKNITHLKDHVMKSKMKTGLTAMLLLLAFSCTKESTNSTAANQPSVSARQSSDALQQSLEEQDVTPIAGTKWILYYDWDCDGSYGSSVMTINKNGTWSNDQGNTGLWIRGQHVFIFRFDNLPNNLETTYSGIILTKRIQGIMSTFQFAGSRKGCFHMEPYSDNFKAQPKTGMPDASGKEQ